MKKIFRLVPALTMAVFLLVSTNTFSQYSTIANVDRTRPDFDMSISMKPMITSFTVISGIGSNEIHWSASMEKEVRIYILEYSYNGVDFQTAGEIVASNRPYSYKHVFSDHAPLFYRLRTEQFDGKYFYSNMIPSGNIAGSSVVEVYPTIVTTNTINLNAFLPVRRVNIVSTNGAQVFAKDMGSLTGTTSMVIPSLTPGTYYLTLYGTTWKETRKLMVQ